MSLFHGLYNSKCFCFNLYGVQCVSDPCCMRRSIFSISCCMPLYTLQFYFVCSYQVMHFSNSYCMQLCMFPIDVHAVILFLFNLVCSSIMFPFRLVCSSVCFCFILFVVLYISARAGVLVRWLRLPAWKVGDRIYVSGGQCHLIYLIILRRFSWPSLAYMFTNVV